MSLEGVHGTVPLPDHQAGFWRQMRAFIGPAMLVSVGYMDPGNWGTDLQGGAQFKYGLLWVVGLASLMAMFLQVISARLGVVTGKDLAQCCREWYPRWTRWPNWLMGEVAIGACDLAEVLGSAVALNLLFHIPLFWAILITALDVLLLLGLQRFGMRTIEAVIALLVATIGVCYFIEIFVLPPDPPQLSRDGAGLVLADFRASGNDRGGHRHHRGHRHAPQLVPALGPGSNPQAGEGREVHSARPAVQHHRLGRLADHCVLHQRGDLGVGRDGVLRHRQRDRADGDAWLPIISPDSDWIRVAYLTLAPLLGTAAASTLFAVALLASGQSSTITGTLAGQVVMEGFMQWRLAPWIRRLLTRTLAILPAIVIVGLRGDSSVNDLLVLSQVVLALQLPFAMFPLLHFTSSRKRMGAWKNGWFLLIAGWLSALLITAMDLYGLPDSITRGVDSG